MGTTNCPSREQLLAYHSGQLDGPASRASAAHLATCPICQAVLQTAVEKGNEALAVVGSCSPGQPSVQPPDISVVSAAEPATDPHNPGEQRHPDENLDSTLIWQVGEYQLLEKISAAGMAVVYRARHTKLNRLVVVKLLPANLVLDAKAHARFRREMAAVGAIEHPNVVWASDAGEHEGSPYIVMEYVDGLNLSEIIAGCGPLAIADACDIVRQAAGGLQCIHEHGLVHRDIKPSNLMLSRVGIIKILDLGLARLRAGESAMEEQITEAAIGLGTADYMAPEQASDARRVDIRADIYGLGCTLYEMLAGRPPFGDDQHDTLVKKLAAHAREVVPPIQKERPEVPEELARVLHRMLAKDCNARFTTPVELSGALERLSEGSDLVAVFSQLPRSTDRGIQVPDAATTAGQVGRSTSKDAQLGKSSKLSLPARRRAWIKGILGLAIFAMLCVLAGVLIRIRTRDGTLIVDISEPNCLVEVSDERGAVEVADRATGKSITISVDRGKHRLKVSKDGFDFFTREFAMESGGTTRLTARLELLDGAARAEDSAAPAAVDDLPSLEKAVEALDPGSPPAATEAVRERLVSFAARRRGTSEEIATRQLMSKLVWPVDLLERTAIPAYELKAAGLGDPANAPVELVAILGNSRMKQWQWIRGIAYSPDGTRIATSSLDGHIKIWETATGAELQTLQIQGLNHGVEAIRFLSDGKTLVAAGPTDLGRWWLRSWDTLSGQERCVYRSKQSMQPWVAGAGTEWRCLSPDGGTFAVAWSNNAVLLADTETGERQRPLRGHVAQVRSVAFSHDSSLVASGDESGLAIIWDAVGGTLQQRIESDYGLIRALAFSPDKAILATGHDDGAIRLWKASTGEPIRALTGHGGPIEALAFAPDGGILAASAAGSSRAIRLWYTGTWDLAYTLPLVEMADASCLTFSPDGKVLASAHGHLIGLWNVTTGQRVNDPIHHPQEVFSVAIDPHGKNLAYGSGDDFVRIGDLIQGKETQLLRFVDPKPFEFVSNGSRLFAANVWGDVALFDVASGRRDSRLMNIHLGWPAVSAIAPNESLMALAGDKMPLSIWDFAELREMHILEKQTGQFTALAFSPNGVTCASAGRDGRVILWDAAPFKERRVVTVVPGGLVACLSFSPNGAILAGGLGDGSIRLWDVSTSTEIDRLSGHPPRSEFFPIPENIAIAFSADGRHLASTGADGTLRMWSLPKGLLLKSMRIGPPWGVVFDLVFTPDGRHLITGNANGTAYVLRLGAPPGPVHQVADWLLRNGGRLSIEGDPNTEFSTVDELPGWEPRIRGIDLRGCSALADDDLARLAVMTDIEWLRLNDQITEKGLVHLVDLPNLRELVLGRPDLGDQGIDHVARCRSLRQIEFRGGRPQPEVIDKIRRALPDCRIEARGLEPPLAIAPFNAEQATNHQQTWAGYLGTPVEVKNSIGLSFVLIPPGEFVMGSEGTLTELVETLAAVGGTFPFQQEFPQHRVRITKPLYLSTCEVTVGQFGQFVEDTGFKTEAETTGEGARDSRVADELQPACSWKTTGFGQTADHPVVNVTWNDAMAFCKWLSDKEGKRYRLPTEAEWEHACRAGVTTRYYSGNDLETLFQTCNFGQIAASTTTDGYEVTAPVGSLRPNSFGLYDMHGNVWEWCADGNDPNYYRRSPLEDPSGPHDVHNRVVRGGAWADDAMLCRSASRFGYYAPDVAINDIGFRIVLEPPTPGGEPASGSETVDPKK